MDAIAQLDAIAEQQTSLPLPDELDKVQEPEALPVNLPAGFRFRQLKQRHLMNFYEHELEQEYKSVFHRNYAVCKAAIVANWFEAPVKIEPDDLDDMDIHDVQMLWEAINNHALNTIRIKKN